MLVLHPHRQGVTYLLGKVTGFIDVPISLLFQLKDDLSLLLSLILVVLDFFFQVPLGLFMELYQVYLFLGHMDCLKHVLKIKTREQSRYSKCVCGGGGGGVNSPCFTPKIIRYIVFWVNKNNYILYILFRDYVNFALDTHICRCTK